MKPPVHVSEIPPSVRSVLDDAKGRWQVEDQRFSIVIQAAARDSAWAAGLGSVWAAELERKIRHLQQDHANASRIPAVCQKLHTLFPSLSWRRVFQYVALHTGLHAFSVARLYYQSTKEEANAAGHSN